MGEKKLNTNNIQFRSVQLQNLCFKQCYNKKLSYRRNGASVSCPCLSRMANWSCVADTLFLCGSCAFLITARCYAWQVVPPSVTLRYGDHIGWNISKIILRLISQGFSLSAVFNIRVVGYMEKVAGVRELRYVERYTICIEIYPLLPRSRAYGN